MWQIMQTHKETIFPCINHCFFPYWFVTLTHTCQCDKKDPERPAERPEHIKFDFELWLCILTYLIGWYVNISIKISNFKSYNTFYCMFINNRENLCFTVIFTKMSNSSPSRCSWPKKSNLVSYSWGSHLHCYLYLIGSNMWPSSIIDSFSHRKKTIMFFMCLKYRRLTPFFLT